MLIRNLAALTVILASCGCDTCLCNSPWPYSPTTAVRPPVHLTLPTEPPLVMKSIHCLAVGDFQCDDPDVGRSVANALVVHLNANGRYSIIEHSQFEKIVAELKLPNGQMIDPATAQRIGKLAGAEAMVLGFVTASAPPSISSRAYIAVQFSVFSVGTGKCLLSREEKEEGDVLSFGVSSEQAQDALIQDVSKQCAGRLCGYEYCTRHLMKGGRYSISRIPNQLGIDTVMQGTSGRLWKEAEGYFETALKEDPNNAGALNNLAIASEVAGKNELAMEYYQKACQLSGHYRILENLIRFMDRNAGRGAKPVTLLDRPASTSVSASVPSPVQTSMPTVLKPTAPQSPR